MTRSEAATRQSGRPIPSNGGMELAAPECAKGIGNVILAPDSGDLIDGIRLRPFAIHPDDRGYFAEVQRMGLGFSAEFPPETTQVSAARNYAGTIKAFHYHCKQTDLWSPVQGMFQVALVDLRLQSPTFGRRNTLYIGELRPWQLMIPPGIAHGYKIVGNSDALLVYLTDRFYDPSDEGRLPYDDSAINYDWETQHK